MKKLIILFTIVMLGAVAGFGVSAKGKKKDVAAFTTTHVDFGTVKATGGQVKLEFPFTNPTSQPIGVVGVTNGGCGCTMPFYSREPIMPGKSSSITVKFDPKSFKGEVSRAFKVTFDPGNRTYVLHFSGIVLPE